jgi:hypothetical protein
MISRRTLVALIGAFLVLASPMAWGCDSMEAGVCQMSACPMSAAGGSMPGCHEVDGASQDCGSVAPVPSACCQAPLDRRPIDSAPTGQLDLLSGLFLAEVELSTVQERLEPLADSEATIASQRYELGRYTLLSSFLI